MKKNKIFKISVLLVLTVLIISVIFITNNTYANQQEVQRDTKNFILDGYERQKVDVNSPIEEISECSKEQIPELSEKSRQLLNSFNNNNMLSISDEKSTIVNENSFNIKEVKKVYNTALNRETTRITLESVEIDLDNKGDIVNYKNLEDFPIGDKDKRDYNDNEELPKIDYQIKEISQLSDIISLIETENNLDGYKLINCSNDLEGVWTLTWCKDYGNELVNSYDCANVIIDAKDGSIMLFGKNKVEPNTIEPIIMQEEALKLAEPITSKFDNKNIEVKLNFFKPNFYWEDDGPYEEADFIRLSWDVSIKDCMNVQIDAETGETLGGGTTRATDCGRSMFIEPFDDAAAQKEHAKLGYDAMKRLGYNQVEYPPVDYRITRDDMMWQLGRPDCYGLYLACHGGLAGDVSYIEAFAPRTLANWKISHKEITGNWHFVFLSACLSSYNTNFANAFKATGAGRCFVGWNIIVNNGTALKFEKKFLSRLGTMPVFNNVIISLNETKNEGCNSGEKDCNPGFYGDSNYWGWAW